MALTQITEKGIKDGEIVNADVNASAAIAKSKLAGLDIVNADVNASAAIAGSKLAASTTSVAGSMSAADKTKLDGVAASANNYTHPTSNGNKHIPADGSAGQFLKYDSAGTAVWAADNNTVYTHPNHSGDVTSSGDGATTIADNAVTLAKMASGTDGQIITYDASGDPIAVGPGTDGQVLTSTGAGSPPAFETIAASPITALNNATANELVTVGSTTTELDAESTLTYNGSDTLKVQPSSAAPAVFIGDSNRTSADQHLAQYVGTWNGTNVARMVFAAGADTTNKDEGRITFDTAAPGGTLTERLRIDENGIITKGIQPAFRATKGGTGFTHSAGTVPYSNEVFDKNNDYDGTDTFTAPVDGVYLFMSSIMVKNGGSGEEHHFQVNGSNANKTQWYSAGGSNTWDNNDMVCILNLSANDTVRVYVNDADLHGGIYMHFSGYLLG